MFLLISANLMCAIAGIVAIHILGGYISRIMYYGIIILVYACLAAASILALTSFITNISLWLSSEIVVGDPSLF